MPQPIPADVMNTADSGTSIDHRQRQQDAHRQPETGIIDRCRLRMPMPIGTLAASLALTQLARPHASIKTGF
jgi:hypothetical protein